VKKLSGFILLSGLLAVLLPGSRTAQSQSSCNSQGLIVYHDELCDCTEQEVLLPECQGISGPRCDPLADWYFCGSHCAIGYASDNCGGSAPVVSQLRLSEPPPLAGPHPCFDNSALGNWLDARMSQGGGAHKSSSTVGSM
jgi:hypothetical protein